MCGKLRNLQTVGSLWMGFFRFYCEFPFREQIDITTRRNPTVRRVAVEIRDPFDEDHDLARVLRLQGENLIRNCFHSALELFNRIEFLQPDLTDASKLAFFEWIVEQVENSHPFEKMTTCWTCGHGDHYKSVCEVYAQRRKERELEEGNEEASGGGKDNRDGDSNDKARRKRPTRRNVSLMQSLEISVLTWMEYTFVSLLLPDKCLFSSAASKLKLKAVDFRDFIQGLRHQNSINFFIEIIRIIRNIGY